MERFLTTSEARQKFLSLVEEVGDGDQIVIAKRGFPKAELINFEQLETIKAVARLWQDLEAFRAMQVSIRDLKKGKVLRSSGKPKVAQILSKARKKDLLRG
jgi:prevent-host-death family protein|tara:strand:- start:175 stop:477 length:303 start_codon:yes stop_codon:yes gene_type:complete